MRADLARPRSVGANHPTQKTDVRTYRLLHALDERVGLLNDLALKLHNFDKQTIRGLKLQHFSECFIPYAPINEFRADRPYVRL